MVISDEYVRNQCRAVSGVRLNKLETKLWAWFGESMGLLAIANKMGSMSGYYHGLALGKMIAANSLTLGFIHHKSLWFEFDFRGDNAPNIIPMYYDKRIRWAQIATYGESQVCVITGVS